LCLNHLGEHLLISNCKSNYPHLRSSFRNSVQNITPFTYSMVRSYTNGVRTESKAFQHRFLPAEGTLRPTDPVSVYLLVSDSQLLARVILCVLKIPIVVLQICRVRTHSPPQTQIARVQIVFSGAICVTIRDEGLTDFGPGCMEERSRRKALFSCPRTNLV